jgi:hypothetical protein
MSYTFFWMIHRRLSFICQRFGTPCLFHLHRQVGMKKIDAADMRRSYSLVLMYQIVEKQRYHMTDAFDVKSLSINDVFKLTRILGEHKIFLIFLSKVTEIPPLGNFINCYCFFGYVNSKLGLIQGDCGFCMPWGSFLRPRPDDRYRLWLS